MRASRERGSSSSGQTAGPGFWRRRAGAICPPGGRACAGVRPGPTGRTALGDAGRSGRERVGRYGRTVGQVGRSWREPHRIGEPRTEVLGSDEHRNRGAACQLTQRSGLVVIGTAFSLAVLVDMSRRQVGRGPARMHNAVRGRGMERHPDGRREEQQGSAQDPQTGHGRNLGLPTREGQALTTACQVSAPYRVRDVRHARVSHPMPAPQQDHSRSEVSPASSSSRPPVGGTNCGTMRGTNRWDSAREAGFPVHRDGSSTICPNWP